MPSLSPAVRQQRPNESLTGKLLLVITLLPLLLVAAMQLGKAAKSVATRGDNTYPESTVVQTAIWSKTSGRIYPDLDRSPYTPAPYGPLFYVALTALAKMGSMSFDGLMLFGRTLTLAVYLLVATAAYLWEKRHLRRVLALLAPILILTQVDFVDWNVTVRPDLPALGLAVAALMVLSTRRLSWKHIIIAGVLCGLAGAIKQSFIALPLAAMVWLLWSRRLKWAAGFAAATAVTGGSILAVLMLRHEPVMSEMLLARYSPVSFMAAVQLLKADLVQYPLQMVVFGLGLLGLNNLPTDEDPNLRQLMVVYFGLAWLVGFYTAMAPGANVNAFLEGWTLAALLAPFAFAKLAQEWEGLGKGAKGLLLILWLSIAVVTLDRWRVIATAPGASMQTLAQLVSGRRVLTDFPFVAAHSLQPEMLDPSVNHYLELGGHWSSQPVLNELRSRAFDYVIIGESNGAPRSWRGLTLFSRSILQEVKQDYTPLCEADRFVIYARPGEGFDSQKDAALLRKTGCRQVSR